MIEYAASDLGFHYQIEQTTHAGHASKIAKDNLAQGFTAIVAIGGDGTINEVAKSLIHTHEVLGIIPCGSGNGLARHLGISLDPSKAIFSLPELHTTRIDTGILNQQPFLCTAGIGLEGEVTRQFNQIEGRGLWNYVKASLKSFLGFQSFVRVENPNTPLLNITIANASQWGNNVHIAPKASLTDHQLDIGVIRKFAQVWAPLLAIRLLTKSLDRSSYFDSKQSARFQAQFDRELPMQADGEYLGSYDFADVEMVPSSLTVLCAKTRI